MRNTRSDVAHATRVVGLMVVRRAHGGDGRGFALGRACVVSYRGSFPSPSPQPWSRQFSSCMPESRTLGCPSVSLPAADWAVVGDFNGDGRLDVVVAGHPAPSNSCAVTASASRSVHVAVRELKCIRSLPPAFGTKPGQKLVRRKGTSQDRGPEHARLTATGVPVCSRGKSRATRRVCHRDTRARHTSGPGCLALPSGHRSSETQAFVPLMSSSSRRRAAISLSCTCVVATIMLTYP